ncbi:hypothetical protein GIB67_030009 [Kingdonia uniflora]|uniref:K+ potassium transporter integral membrane domain-containing protein n=1 Tax=Kingdonia uniflora TaxID=39325 RepID=A0A7J7MXT4_9MAGN|nr:hypothetical protein GIB67_030009 [Kingdonia uniflora]
MSCFTIQSKAKVFLENSSRAQSILTFVVLLGTCMVIGDGALTPAISVLSAVQRIQSRSAKIEQSHVVMISCAILLVLFLFQRFGTGASPHYMYLFFKRNGTKGWELLGAVTLCITGAEAMFADLGHFNKGSIQMAFSFLVYPALIVTYAGQGAYLIKNPENISTAFYSSVPGPVFWPVFIVATLAAIVASQALISASFSIIRQSMALGCFPRVNMIHTSNKHEGQVYSPEMNYFLMVACLIIMIGFQGGEEIGNAYGFAVIWVMIITTCLMTVVMLVIWNTKLILILAFFLFFFFFVGLYMIALINKVPKGPKEVYRCLIQYGYKDAPNMEGAEFVASVVEKLKEEIEDIDEMAMLESTASKGAVYVLGRTILKSSEKNEWVAHCVINYSYIFLQ